MTIDDRASLKQCRICGEEIRLVALKCIRCDSYQDWRRVLPVSTSVLALVVALISVTTTASPVLIGILTAKNSKLVVTFQNVDETAISVLVSNTGTRPGTVRFATLTIATNFPRSEAEPKGNKYLRLTVGGAAKHPTVLVNPDATVAIDFVSAAYFGSGWFFKTAGVQRNNLICELSVAFSNYNGSDGTSRISAPCDQFSEFISSHVRFDLPDR